jgi:hypothetical protein
MFRSVSVPCRLCFQYVSSSFNEKHTQKYYRRTIAILCPYRCHTAIFDADIKKQADYLSKG